MYWPILAVTCSSLAGATVRNRVAAAILNRIRKAVREQAKFRVVVIVPVHPEGTWRDNPNVRYIMRVREGTRKRRKQREAEARRRRAREEKRKVGQEKEHRKPFSFHFCF